MGKAEENKTIKRNALLSHAFSLFMNNGVANTSISDITAQAGVAKGTFYSYFRDKEDLIQKLIAQRSQQLFQHALNELKSQPDMPVDESIIFISNDILNQLIANKNLHKFINKNLMFGLYKKALLDESIRNDSFFTDSFIELIEKDGEEWNDPILMLYTIAEFIGSTCYSIILYNEPVSYEYYKPYMFNCIKGIISVFRK